jgi:hypothetical protein
VQADASRTCQSLDGVSLDVGDHDSGGVSRSTRRQPVDQLRAVGRIWREEDFVAGEVLSVGLRVLVRGLGREEVCRASHDAIVHFLERRNVHDPDRSAVGRRDQLTIAGMDFEIVHRNCWQPGHETLPARSAISRHVCTEISPDKQQVAIDQILTNDVNKVGAAGGQIVGDRTKRSAEVVRDVQIRMEVVLAVIVERDIDSRCIEVRRLDAIHPRLLR